MSDDDEPICLVCEESYCLRQDYEPTGYCDGCAQLLVAKLLAALEKMVATSTTHGPDYDGCPLCEARNVIAKAKGTP
jgi:hypothetical protein